MHTTEWLDGAADVAEWLHEGSQPEAAANPRAERTCDEARARGASRLDVVEARTMLRALTLPHLALLNEARAEAVSTAVQAADAERLAAAVESLAPDLADDLYTVAAEWAMALRFAAAERECRAILGRL